MRRPDIRHYTEEELLLHILGEESPESMSAIESHFESCHECRSVCHEYEALVISIRAWQVPELPEESWRAQKAQLLALYRQDRQSMIRAGLLEFLKRSIEKMWGYALENPLPTLGYVAAAVAFASERTITTFRLDRVLPATAEVFKIIRQVL